MVTSRRDFLRFAGISALGMRMANSALMPAAMAAGQPGTISAKRHLLNRTTWGARPQDVENLQQMGIEAYIDWQLNPETINDPFVDQFVSSRQILAMPYEALAQVAEENYGFVFQTALWARIYRAVFSERQLYERMVDFWSDHFNVPIADLLTEKVIDDRDVVRKNALGRFRDLLFASAQSPAMLYYLNNAESSKDHPNENYAREVMELHTLGVDGGYSEDDVIAVARAFTGWTVREGEFYFDMDDHDSDEKLVLGHQLPAGRGIEDGLHVLDILARHPSTAQFISRKLARRFISDNPPQSVIDRMAQVFAESGGDIRQIMRHLLLSEEFAAAVGQKFRRPMEALVAMLRLLQPGLDVQDPQPLLNRLEQMGQLPFFWHPPNGYPDVAGPWITSSGLLMRWNTAMELALAGDGYFDGSVVNLDLLIPPANTVGDLVDSVTAHVFGTDIAPSDRDMLIGFLSRSGDEQEAVTADLRVNKLPAVVGLLMASPYFQWY